MIPLPYKILGAVAIAAALLACGYWRGAQSVRVEWASAKLQQQLADSFVATENAEKSVEIVTQYVDRVKVIHEKGVTIIKEVPVYVPSDSCALPGGFRVLHDAAATDSLPDPSRVADAPAVDAQTATATVVDNYTTCNAIREQLIALQTWAATISRAP